MHAELVLASSHQPVRRFALRMGQTFVVGRADDVTIQLQDSSISRRHASFELRADGVYVQDLGSRNGTHVRGALLEAHAPVLVEDGEGVSVGSQWIEVRLRDAARDERPGDGTHRIQLPPLPNEEFEVLGEIGRGGTGRVYAAVQRLMRRKVAIKVLSPELGADAVERERFLRQGWICTKIVSPYVAQVYDVRMTHGQLILVMELVEGPSVRDRLEDGPLPLCEALRIAHDVAEALAAAAKVGVVHRDVKPSNVLLAPTHVAKLVDFGIAKATDPGEVASLLPLDATPVQGFAALSGGGTPHGEGLGTLGYAAPEQTVEARAASTRSDLYALGATLYHMLAGASPHVLLSADPDELLAKLRAGASVPALGTVVRRCPPDVSALVHALLAVDPEARPPSPVAVAHRLHLLRMLHCPEAGNARQAGLTTTEEHPRPA